MNISFIFTMTFMFIFILLYIAFKLGCLPSFLNVDVGEVNIGAISSPTQMGGYMESVHAINNMLDM